MIAASEDPDFLRPEPVALEDFTLDALRKWITTAERRLKLGSGAELSAGTALIAGRR